MEALPALAQDDGSGANPSSVKSDDSSPRRDSGAGSPPPNCAICLGTCKNKSFTDSCLHQFCFSCLLTWSKVKAECPLCKQAFRSIIHNVRSNHQYEEYLVVQRQNEESSSRIDIDSVTAATRRFRYRTTLTLPRRETIAIQQLLLHYPLMADVFPSVAPRVPVTRRRREPDAFRRTVYRHNLWARPLPDFTGRFRDCTPEFYRYNDTQIHRLVPWLNRELHYLLNENVGHISYVMSRILELLPQHHINSLEFRTTMQRYFGDRTEHFLHELFCFASTPYDMTGYDRNVQYTTDSRISTMINEIISSSDSEASVDSDIVVMVSGSEPAEPPPGPSRLPAPVYPQNYISQPINNNVIPIETISHSDTDDDSSEVMVVGYIKPPQDRTPEVVDLLGSDSDVIVQETSQPEPSNVEGNRAAPAVKLTLKRHRSRDSTANADSDSDDTYTPPPRLEKRHRIEEPSSIAGTANSTQSTQSTQSSRASKRRRTTDMSSSTNTSLIPTPSPSPMTEWGSHGMFSASSSPSITTTSSSSSSDESSSSSSDESSDDSIVRRRISKKKIVKKSSKGSMSSRDRRRTKKRSSRSNHRDRKRQASLERNKRNKRKSNTGKGVKSSRKVIEASAPSVQQTAMTSEQAGPSGMSSRHSRNSSKERKRRRRDSRETRRLRSVVNVMYNNNANKNTGDQISSGKQNNVVNDTKTDVELAAGGCSPRVQERTGDHGELPGTSLRRPESSDSEDNLPLNLTLQKLCPYS